VRYGKSEEISRPGVVAHVTRTLGEPFYRSPSVAVWRLPID